MTCKNCGANIPDGSKFCNECGTQIKIDTIQCGNCGETFDAQYGVCPHCGWYENSNHELDSQNIEEEIPQKLTPDEVLEQVVGKPMSYTALGYSILKDNNQSISDIGTNEKNKVLKNDCSQQSSEPNITSEKAMSTKTRFTRKTELFLWLEWMCFFVAQIFAWFAPWTKLNTDEALVELFANPKIHYLNHLESPASVLNYYGATVNTGLYTFSAFLMLAAGIITIVYFVLNFNKKPERHPKGTIGATLLILASLLIELYRLSINSALNKTGLSEIYSFSSSGVSVAVIVLAILALYFGNKHKKESHVVDEGEEQIDDLQEINYIDPKNWEESVKELETEEIINRYTNSDEWSVGYRKVCYNELLHRGFTLETIKQKINNSMNA